MISKIKGFFRTERNSAKVNDITVNPGGAANITAEHFQGVGEDSQPLESDFALLVRTVRKGSAAAVGFLDPINAGITGPGEKRIYARDENGDIVVELYLKNDGSAVLSNDSGSMILQANGNFLINGVTIDTGGNITTGGNIQGNTIKQTDGGTIDLRTHVHGGVESGGDTSGPAQ